MVPTASSNLRATELWLPKDKRMRKRYQKLEDLTKIMLTITDEGTNLRKWGREKSVHITAFVVLSNI